MRFHDRKQIPTRFGARAQAGFLHRGVASRASRFGTGGTLATVEECGMASGKPTERWWGFSKARIGICASTRPKKLGRALWFGLDEHSRSIFMTKRHWDVPALALLEYGCPPLHGWFVAVFGRLRNRCGLLWTDPAPVEGSRIRVYLSSHEYVSPFRPGWAWSGPLAFCHVWLILHQLTVPFPRFRSVPTDGPGSNPKAQRRPTGGFPFE